MKGLDAAPTAELIRELEHRIARLEAGQKAELQDKKPAPVFTHISHIHVGGYWALHSKEPGEE